MIQPRDILWPVTDFFAEFLLVHHFPLSRSTINFFLTAIISPRLFSTLTFSLSHKHSPSFFALTVNLFFAQHNFLCCSFQFPRSAADKDRHSELFGDSKLLLIQTSHCAWMISLKADIEAAFDTIIRSKTCSFELAIPHNLVFADNS